MHNKSNRIIFTIIKIFTILQINAQQIKVHVIYIPTINSFTNQIECL